MRGFMPRFVWENNMKQYLNDLYRETAEKQEKGEVSEIWKTVRFFPNYEVSSEGRIRNISTGNIKQPKDSGLQSQRIELINNGSKAIKHIDYLVLEAFCRKPFAFGSIIHLNGNLQDNRLCNLIYEDTNLNSQGFVQIPDYPKYSVNKHGVVINNTTNRILKLSNNKKGYLAVKLQSDGKKKSFLVHRLVATVFIPNPDNLPQINHKNGIKRDNRVSNLEWCSQSENMQHAQNYGLAGFVRNEKKLKDDEIPRIRKLAQLGVSIKIISEVYEVSYQNIHLILNNQIWDGR